MDAAGEGGRPGTAGEAGLRNAPPGGTGGTSAGDRERGRPGGLPDPLADALLNGAQRAYLDMAAGASRACPGWDITWDLEGFTASDGQVSLGPKPSPSEIVALVRAAR